MRILNIQIRDFRNIVRADINFGKLNILTGKNSSGKSNFLLALTHSLSLNKDYSEIFSKNIVTFHPGKDQTSIVSKISDLALNVCYLGQSGENSKDFYCINPKYFTFEKIIDKKSSSSKSHRLFFTGGYYENSNGPIWSEFTKSKDTLKLYTEVNDKEVYSELFLNETQQNETKIIQVAKKELPNQEKYLSLFAGFQDTIISWIKQTGIKSEPLMSSDLIHRYVTSPGNSEIYEQALERIKAERKPYQISGVSFEKSKFIFLLADLERNEKQKENLTKDLVLYTKGIIKDISISKKGINKGEIVVSSPNGPKDIWTISQGTSIILFFIVLLNWISLPNTEKSYSSPNIMIFDEIDSIIHPRLMNEFKEVLTSLSLKVQLFMSTHSPYFIDGFDKNQLYLLKDTPSLPGTKKLSNRCNIYDYQTIIEKLPEEDRADLLSKSNSELFIDGSIEALFPNEDAND
jgi:predicted ATP-dependent endonuclease of OLD family